LNVFREQEWLMAPHSVHERDGRERLRDARVKYDRLTVTCHVHCFLSEPLHGRVQDVAPRTSYLNRTLCYFPSRHLVTSHRHWKLGRWSLRRRLVYRKVSSSRRFHLPEPDLTCSRLPNITLPTKYMHPRHLLLGPTLSSLSLAARISSSQCFNGNFQSSTCRPSSSHPQRFSFLSRRQTPAPLVPTQF